MKSIKILLALCCILILAASCASKNGKGCTRTITETREEVIYFNASELRSEPKILDAQVLKHPGKVFWDENYIFVTEKNDGIHVVDASDPTKLKTVKYIKIPGNQDVAAKGNYLYADSYGDLLVFDISSPTNPKLTHRLDSVWNWDNVIGHYIATGQEKLVTKETKFVTRKYLVACDEDVDIATKSEDGGGQAGSMARFCVSGSYMYAVDDYDLYVFSVQAPSNPVLANKQRIDDKIETIFKYGERLFIGGLQGVYIYDKKDPLNPVKLNHFKHIESCDPVVVDNNYAYITTRKESTCRRGENKLIVLDVKDFSNAQLVAEYPMEHPHGLGVKDNRLYLSEGKKGLKVFDITDKKAIDQHLVARDSTVHSYDLIPHDYQPLLLLVGDDGLMMYGINHPDSLKRLGSLLTFGN